MEALLIPFGVAVFAWWFSTGAILWLVHHVRLTGAGTLISAAVVALAGYLGMALSSTQDSTAGAYAGFAAALLVWGGIELTFLKGLITGPNRGVCPRGAAGWTRFKLATATLIHHEVLILAAAVAVTLACMGQPNQTGPLAFATLALMRLSAKFNIFFGAPALSEELMPQQIRHMQSYFRRGAFNLVFPVSILIGACAASFAAAHAFSAPIGSAAAVGGALVFSLIVLALAEHALMMTPLDDSALWRWAARRKASAAEGQVPLSPTLSNPASAIAPAPHP